jgi:transposase
MGDSRLEPLVLSEAERRTLESGAKRRKTAQGLALRARIVLACAEGRSNTAVAARLGVSRPTVTKWRARFLARRLDGLGDEPRPGVPRTITDAQVEEVIVRILEETPEGATHWSKRELARRAGISPTSVHRIWRAFGLQPHRTEGFKISPGPLLIDKIRDVAGLYLAPPANAAVFAVDEKPQIQALQRTAPVLPMIPGTPERRSFDYTRHGTIDLFAALNTATGKAIGKVSAQHRAVDFRDFLDEIDRQVDPGLDIHVICDNLSAHKAPPARKWLLAHPRVQLHFTPTYSSWISQVERWLAELQRRCLDRGVFCSLDDLTTALEDCGRRSARETWTTSSNSQAPLTRWLGMDNVELEDTGGMPRVRFEDDQGGALATQQAGAVILALSHDDPALFADPFFAEVIGGVSTALEKTDLVLMLLADSGNGRARLERILRSGRCTANRLGTSTG